jgi:outer membrane biosynthesis protein TonB
VEIVQDKYKRRGLIGTILFHGLILLLLIIWGLTTPLPLPEEEGILISFGNTHTGTGEIQPQQSAPASSAVASVPEVEETPVLTQDHEVSVAVPKKDEVKPKPKPVEKPKEKPKETVKPNTTIPRETPKETPKEEPKVNPDAMYPGKQNTSNTSSSQGNTGTPGDQGDPTGSNTTAGTGLGSTGVSYDLSGRNWRVKPNLTDDSQEFGRVVIEIIVDKYGNVTSATGPARGSTTTSLHLLNKSKEAALRAKFNQDLNDLEERKGSITFVFSPR